MWLSLPRSWHLSRAKLVLLVLLAMLLLVGTTPHYISQNWPWKMPPPVVQLKQLRQIREQGITLANWKNQTEQAVVLGDHRWYLQNMAQGEKRATLFLMPQSGPRKQPQVEWSDIEGIQRWQSDSYSTLTVNVERTDTQPSQKQTFEARFFRAWTGSRTYAVAQWYAQSDGGSPIAGKWYLADRVAQWQQRRIPWIAVSIQIPIEALDDVGKYQDPIVTLAQEVQTSLNQQIFYLPPDQAKTDKAA